MVLRRRRRGRRELEACPRWVFCPVGLLRLLSVCEGGEIYRTTAMLSSTEDGRWDETREFGRDGESRAVDTYTQIDQRVRPPPLLSPLLPSLTRGEMRWRAITASWGRKTQPLLMLVGSRQVDPSASEDGRGGRQRQRQRQPFGGGTQRREGVWLAGSRPRGNSGNTALVGCLCGRGHTGERVQCSAVRGGGTATAVGMEPARQPKAISRPGGPEHRTANTESARNQSRRTGPRSGPGLLAVRSIRPVGTVVQYRESWSGYRTPSPPGWRLAS